MRPLTVGARTARTCALLSLGGTAAAVVLGATLLIGAAPAGARANNHATDRQKHRSNHRMATTTKIRSCMETDVQAKLDFSDTEKGSTAKAGAILFKDTSPSTCELDGVPTVGLVTAEGNPVASYQEKTVLRHVKPAVLKPEISGTGTTAAASITWSFWTCPTTTYSVTAAFPGWTGFVTMHPATLTTTLVCTGTVPTLYVGAVEATT